MKYEKDQWVIYQGVPHYIQPVNDIYIPEDKEYKLQKDDFTKPVYVSHDEITGLCEHKPRFKIGDTVREIGTNLEYKIVDDDPFDHFLPYCIEDENNNSRWVTPYQLYILNY